MDESTAVLADIRRDWASAGLTGTLLARDLDSRREIGFGAHTIWPLASVIKLPLALVCYDAFDAGDLDPAAPVRVDPATATNGPTGISLFVHPATVAMADLVQSSLAVSDNAATDLLLAVLPPDEVTERLERLGHNDIVVRHPMRSLYGVHGAPVEVQHTVAAAGSTEGGGHVLPALDVNRANTGTGQALLDLLDRVWRDDTSTPAVCERLRAALGRQLLMHRLAVDLVSDEVTVRSKTGTFLHLRHEVGVVESDTDRIAVVALTSSSVPATVQMEAEFAIGRAARMVVDALRRRGD